MSLSPSVLVVDDEQAILRSMRNTLASQGIESITTCDQPETVLALVEDNHFDLVLLDLWMPKVSGGDLLKALNRDHPDLPVIIVTGANDVETAVESMKAGATDYLLKPIEPSRLMTCVRHAFEVRELKGVVQSLQEGILEEHSDIPQVFEKIVTTDRKMLGLFRLATAVAPTLNPVLITGETGVGKELFARAIHEISGRKGPFIAVNASGLDDSMFSDTLFGHTRGAFTGAVESREGLIRKARGGTLFLDEIGDLSETSQLKLLRLIQEGEYQPVGSDSTERSDIRLLTATLHNLRKKVEAGAFRRDLFYRLAVHHINIPPLRERKNDIPFLLEHFFELIAGELNKRKPAIPRELIDNCTAYPFPGNIRELENLVRDAISRHQTGKLSLKSFLEAMNLDDMPESHASEDINLNFPERLPYIKVWSDLLVDEALRRSGNNQTVAARLLGITQQSLSQRLIKRNNTN